MRKLGPQRWLSVSGGDYLCTVIYLYLASAPYHESCSQSQQGRKRSTSLNFVSALTDRPAVGLPGALNLHAPVRKMSGSCRNGDSILRFPLPGPHTGFFKRVYFVQ